MSEEQKEYEAMQLVNLMDKMQKQVEFRDKTISRISPCLTFAGSDLPRQAGRGRQTRGCGARAAADRGQRPGRAGGQ